MDSLNLAKAAAAAKTAAESPEAQAKEQAKLREACRMFEATFLSLLWKEMRRTAPKTGIMHGGFAEDMFTSMLDEAVSEASAKTGSMGIASLLQKQLSQKPEMRPGAKIGQNLRPLVLPGGGSASAAGKSQGYLRRPLKPLAKSRQPAATALDRKRGLAAGPGGVEAEQAEAANFAAALSDMSRRGALGFYRSF